MEIVIGSLFFMATDKKDGTNALAAVYSNAKIDRSNSISGIAQHSHIDQYRVRQTSSYEHVNKSTYQG